MMIIEENKTSQCMSIVIFFLLLTIISGEDTFDCTGYEDDSYHPVYDADDCRHYWHCIYVNTVYVHAVKRACPAGTEFDVTLRQCETASEVNCVLVKSPHMPRTKSTTEAWKWRYSKLFSRINWKTTDSSFATTRRHPVFDLGDSVELDATTMILPDIETTEQIQVLPVTTLELTTRISLEQLSKNLHALVLNRHPLKSKPSGANFFQPGEPENEADVYTSSTKQRTRRTRYTTQSTSIEATTQFPLTMLLLTTTTTITTIISASTTMLTTDASPSTSTAITRSFMESDTTIHVNPQPRIGASRYRRNNMTLYILTSDDHKIRQFSVNHTRGILLNCNQLRRRLLGRRRGLRDTAQVISTHESLIFENSSTQTIQCKTLFFILFSLVVFLTTYNMTIL